MAHVQIRGGVADWYWTADVGMATLPLGFKTDLTHLNFT